MVNSGEKRRECPRKCWLSVGLWQIITTEKITVWVDLLCVALLFPLYIESRANVITGNYFKLENIIYVENSKVFNKKKEVVDEI